MPEPDESIKALRDELRHQGLHIEPARFEAFYHAHQRLQGFTEQLRQQSLVSVRHLDVGDD